MTNVDSLKEVEFGEDAGSRGGKRNVSVVDVTDTESAAPWSQVDNDRVRAQYDDMLLARIRAENEFGGADVFSENNSEYGEQKSSPSSGNVERLEGEAQRGRAFEELQDVATRLMRVSSMQMVSEFRKGRVVTGGTRMGAEVRQKIFGLEGTEVLVDLENAGGLYTKLKSGQRVMVQYIARTGIGKTTRFASLVAKNCGLRVLLLEPDMLLARAAAEAQREKTRVRTHWVKKQEEHLTVMTYSDFCGQFQVKNGKMMLDQFDVIIMDEAHIPKAEVYATKAILATHGSGNNSLLVLSATLDGEDSQSINNATLTKELNGRLVDALLAGKLTVGQRCRDRTMLIVATDEEAAQCYEYITDAGHLCYMLDSASRVADCTKIREMLVPSSLVKRFLVVTEKFGTGHNFPLSQVFTDGSRRVYTMNEETRVVDSSIQPVTRAEVKQHAARVGRGLAQGDSSYVFVGSGKDREDVELLSSERLKAYLLMRAAGIVPLSNMMPPRGFFPFGVTPDVASDILAINLPPELAVRYFNRDGRISPNFARALRPFSHLQHYFVTSPLPSPIGFDSWEQVSVGSYYGSDMHDKIKIRVPFETTDSELRAKIHAISAIAMGNIFVSEWNPRLSESEGSGDESTVSPIIVRRGYVPRLVVDSQGPPAPPPKDIPWGFEALIEGQRGFVGKREALVGNDSYSQMTMQYLRETDREKIVETPLVAVQERVDSYGIPRINILDADIRDSPVDVISPGGSVVVSLRKTVWKALSEGKVLYPDEMSSLVRSVKDNVQGFVCSNAFANWSNVWISFLRSCSDDKNLKYIQNRGGLTVIAAILHAMYVRYVAGVAQVTNSSYVKAKFWARILRGRSFEQQLEEDRRKGKVEIIQSERFFKRLYEIRKYSAEAMLKLEEFGVFAPQTTTTMQQVIPIISRTGFGLIDEVADTRGSGVKKRIGHIRSPSDDKSERTSRSRGSLFK